MNKSRILYDDIFSTVLLFIYSLAKFPWEVLVSYRYYKNEDGVQAVEVKTFCS
jgi:hypothetical protein